MWKEIKIFIMKYEDWVKINENFKKLEKSLSNVLIEIESLKSEQKALKKNL